MLSYGDVHKAVLIWRGRFPIGFIDGPPHTETVERCWCGNCMMVRAKRQLMREYALGVDCAGNKTFKYP